MSQAPSAHLQSYGGYSRSAAPDRRRGDRARQPHHDGCLPPPRPRGRILKKLDRPRLFQPSHRSFVGRVGSRSCFRQRPVEWFDSNDP